MANIRVSDSTRDKLRSLARQHPRGRVSMAAVVAALLTEHEREQRALRDRLQADEKWIAEMTARRAQRLEEGHTTQQVLEMLDERRDREAA